MEQVATAVNIGHIELGADITMPDRAKGLALFAHGSGSMRHGPRNYVAGVLNRAAIGTISIDLLTEDEEAIDARTAEFRFDIALLGRRLLGITDWIGRQPRLNELGLGWSQYGRGSGLGFRGAAPDVIRALVSRGGRPDLAGAALGGVRAPALFIVGSEDTVVLGLNRSAMARLPRNTEHRLEIIKGATHLFEEQGSLERAAALARDWFRERLPAPLFQG